MERTPLQKYLDQGYFFQITEELGINVYEHPTLPLIGFKYNQIDSPKTHDVVRWSRGTVLEKGTWNLVAQSFVRFFNLGEGSQDDVKNFNWKNFNCLTKEDGSLSIIYYYGGEWHMNTSGSFGLGPINSYDTRSWRQVVKEVANFNWDKLDKGITYIFELCTPWNKVIRYYPNPKLVMLGAFKGNEECDFETVRKLAQDVGANLVESHSFRSYEDVSEFLARKEKEDVTFEGVVIRDDKGIRYKVKSKTYLALAHMYGNGDLGLPKRILPFVLRGETSEIITYFPELKDKVEEINNFINSEYEKLMSLWKEVYQIESQKDFALAIKDKTKFTGLLFGLRKKLGNNQTEKDLKKIWLESGDLLVKILF